jgi:ParB family chromosome partitioning protein
MTKKNVLGRGLGAIFDDLIDISDERNTFTYCGIEELTPNRFQPRRNLNKENQKELVVSIKNNGVIQPIIVRKCDSGYEIIAGERRWRAAQAAGLKDVPIIIKPNIEDINLAELSLIENIQREELNPIEEAEAYQLLTNNFNLSHEEISLKVGKDRSTISNTIRLLKLPSEVRDALIEKKISSGHARVLLSIPLKNQQIQVLEEILKRNLNVRETERLVKNLNNADISKKKLEKTHDIIDLEKRLSSHLMTKTNIKQLKKGGIIEIKFTSLEDLNRLLDFIVK